MQESSTDSNFFYNKFVVVIADNLNQFKISKLYYLNLIKTMHQDYLEMN